MKYYRWFLLGIWLIMLGSLIAGYEPSKLVVGITFLILAIDNATDAIKGTEVK